MHFLLTIIFVLGYAVIALEHPLRINKAATALLTALLCWITYLFFSESAELINHQLEANLGEISAILFFLLGAMTIVELVDAHNGFDTITNLITTKNQRKLFWIISITTFLLSSILDNLTTAIVMTSLSRKLFNEKKDLFLVLGLIVIAANAGGAWSPIGDVTTTMLWIGGQITAVNIMIKLILPSLVCLLVPMIFASRKLSASDNEQQNISHKTSKKLHRDQVIVFAAGISILILVPVFKSTTHLPPFMGMLGGLGIMWVLTELMHKNKLPEHKSKLTVHHALERIDTSSILFFLGILMAVGALQASGMLENLAQWMDKIFVDHNLIAILLGLLSSVIDNVPLVAASMGMYDLTIFPADHYFWEFLAFSCGTGGSILIIGSAAGVAVMGMEKIDFFWYLKNISLYALLGFMSGCLVYIMMEPLLG